MTTLLELQEAIGRSLRDIDGKTFNALTTRDLINGAIVDLNRVAPAERTETIVPVLNTYEYVTGITEAKRLELWDNSLVPPQVAARVVAASENPVITSNSGFELWNGLLRVSYGTMAQIDVTKHVLKFWGWGPYALLHDIEDVAEFGDSIEYAVREGATFAGFELLMADRSLFTQWQTYPSNSDVSPTQLANMTSYWERRWDRRRKQLRVIRFPV